jgi:NAD(P) transhydrogenase subunit alpha
LPAAETVTAPSGPFETLLTKITDREIGRRSLRRLVLTGVVSAVAVAAVLAQEAARQVPPEGGASGGHTEGDFWSLAFVFALSTFIGMGVIARVSRLLHTPLMSITNAISAIAVVGSIIVAGGDFPDEIRIMGIVALFASMTNIVSGFLITQRMLKMFKKEPEK